MLPSNWLRSGSYCAMYSVIVQCNACTFHSLFVWLMIRSKSKPKIYLEIWLHPLNLLGCNFRHTYLRKHCNCLAEVSWHKLITEAVRFGIISWLIMDLHFLCSRFLCTYNAAVLCICCIGRSTLTSRQILTLLTL